jgi:hypothetical protein
MSNPHQHDLEPQAAAGKDIVHALCDDDGDCASSSLKPDMALGHQLIR